MKVRDCALLLSVVCACAESPPPDAPAPGAASPSAVPSASAAPTAEAKKGPEFWVPTQFSDGMVVERGKPFSVWGSDRPGTVVKVRFADKDAQATAAADGAWKVRFDARDAGGPYELSVHGSQELTAKNVAVGEVWLCSGQSNMEWATGSALNANQELARSNDADLRLFKVNRRPSAAPVRDPESKWYAATPETVSGFSAVCYFFGRELRQKLKVPVGLVQAAWGGTPAEAWVPREAMRKDPALESLVRGFNPKPSSPDEKARYEKAKAEWEAKVKFKDRGNQGFGMGYAKPDFDDSKWQTLEVPGYWQDRGLKVNGAIWFRTTFDIPAKLSGKHLELCLGAIDDYDETYVNGVKVGDIMPPSDSGYATPRRYQVMDRVLKPGKNVIAVRILDNYINGGFTGAGCTMGLDLKGSKAEKPAIPIAGSWRYQVEWSVPKPDELLANPPALPSDARNPNAPGVLYDGMIHPLEPLALGGVLWYQGETNVGRAAQYQKLLPTLIETWRTAFEQPALPFYIVSLANFQARLEAPAESVWAELREAQAVVHDKVHDTGLALTIDIGEAQDIHPRNKQEVGRRLALIALANLYGQNLPYSGPVFKALAREGKRLRVTFDFADELKASDAKPLVGFAVAGKDGVFQWANVRIDKGSVVVESPKVPEPVAVRYGWADNPAVNLVNGALLPAVPFRATVSETPSK